MGDFSAFHDLIMLCMERGDYACATALLDKKKNQFESSKLVGLFSEKLFAPTESSEARNGRLKLFEYLVQNLCKSFNPTYWGKSEAIAFLSLQTNSFAQDVARIMIKHETSTDPVLVRFLATVMLPFYEAKEFMKRIPLSDSITTEKCIQMAVVDKLAKNDYLRQQCLLDRYKKEYALRKETLAQEEVIELQQVKQKFSERKRRLEEEEQEAEKKLKE